MRLLVGRTVVDVHLIIAHVLAILRNHLDLQAVLIAQQKRHIIQRTATGEVLIAAGAGTNIGIGDVNGSPFHRADLREVDLVAAISHRHMVSRSGRTIGIDHKGRHQFDGIAALPTCHLQFGEVSIGTHGIDVQLEVLRRRDRSVLIRDLNVDLSVLQIPIQAERIPAFKDLCTVAEPFYRHQAAKADHLPGCQRLVQCLGQQSLRLEIHLIGVQRHLRNKRTLTLTFVPGLIGIIRSADDRVATGFVEDTIIGIDKDVQHIPGSRVQVQLVVLAHLSYGVYFVHVADNHDGGHCLLCQSMFLGGCYVILRHGNQFTIHCIKAHILVLPESRNNVGRLGLHIGIGGGIEGHLVEDIAFALFGLLHSVGHGGQLIAHVGGIAAVGTLDLDHAAGVLDIGIRQIGSGQRINGPGVIRLIEGVVIEHGIVTADIRSGSDPGQDIITFLTIDALNTSLISPVLILLVHGDLGGNHLFTIDNGDIGRLHTDGGLGVQIRIHITHNVSAVHAVAFLTHVRKVGIGLRGNRVFIGNTHILQVQIGLLVGNVDVVLSQSAGLGHNDHAVLFVDHVAQLHCHRRGNKASGQDIIAASVTSVLHDGYLSSGTFMVVAGITVENHLIHSIADGVTLHIVIPSGAVFLRTQHALVTQDAPLVKACVTGELVVLHMVNFFILLG